MLDTGKSVKELDAPACVSNVCDPLDRLLTILRPERRPLSRTTPKVKRVAAPYQAGDAHGQEIVCRESSVQRDQ